MKKFLKGFLKHKSSPQNESLTSSSSYDNPGSQLNDDCNIKLKGTTAASNEETEWNASLPTHIKIEDKIYNTFKDGIRSIDNVLVYESDSLKDDLVEEENYDNVCELLEDNLSSERDARKREINNNKWRSAYLKNLREAGLELELDIVKSERKIIKFVKLHIPWDVLAKYAEELNFRVPINIQHSDEQSFTEKILRTLKIDKLVSPYNNHEKPPQYYTCLFLKSKVNKYIPSTLYPAYISNSQRQCAIFEILQSTEYNRLENGEIGINRLLKEEAFLAAFPLHEGDLFSNLSRHEPEKAKNSPRAVLEQTWASFSVWYKHQPIDMVRDYYGEKTGLYFAWLGSYTTWLLLPSIVGLIVFFINLKLSYKDVTVNEVCNLGKNITMCPLCDRCTYWNLSDICFQTQTSVLFDNSATLFFAVFMSFWAVSFLEYWKRKNITLAYQWSCLDFEQEDERPRSEFVIKADSTQRNPVTGKIEPGFSKSRRKIRMLAGFGTIVFMIAIVIIFMFAIILYKTFISIRIFTNNTWLKKYAANVSSLSGAVLNLIVILILGRFYEKIAYVLTEWEMHETQTEFENHLTFKVFMFQFVNFYSSIFYVAFFKGKFIGYPGNYNRLLGFRQEDCASGGCLIELSQQFAIIMIGKQMINNVQEFVLPKIKGRIQKCLIKFNKNSSEKTQQEKDLELANHDGLFDEYLEMVLQFGFITSFVAAFPLGPLFALLNNWIEIRLDAQKFVCDTRRSLAQRASNIGIWFDIISTLVNIAVICNGFLIAFTAEYLPKLLYQYKNNWSLVGYTEFSLAYSPVGTYSQQCRYRDFRDDQGNFSAFYWQLLALRLIFVIVFEHIVFTICKLIEVVVPDIPENLSLKIKRERYLAKKALHDAI